VNTVVARFNHPSRDLAEIEDELVRRGVGDARITGYVVAMTVNVGSRLEAEEIARHALDRTGATKIKITKHGAKHALA
jgi:hypothetical protein